MAETTKQTLKPLNLNSKRLYQKYKDVHHDTTSVHSNKDSSTTNTNDWHRLLLTRLKPSATGKYRTTRKDGYKIDSYSSTLLEDCNVTLQSYSDDSSIIDNRQIVITESDASKHFSSLFDSPERRDNHFVKNSITNRTDDHMTSLKRRVRKQQMRHFQQRPSILHETTFQLPSPNNLFMISYPEQTVATRRYRQKKSNGFVSLPLLTNTTRDVSNQMHGMKLNLYGY